MIARLGRFCARCAAARARAAVDAEGSPLADRPPPSTTATSGNPARSPSSVVMRGSDLTERSVHDLVDREVVLAERVLVDRVAVRLPALHAFLVVHWIVSVALPQRNYRKKVVERERGLRDRVLLLGRVEALAHLDDQGFEVDVALLERVLHASAGGVGLNPLRGFPLDRLRGGAPVPPPNSAARQFPLFPSGH